MSELRCSIVMVDCLEMLCEAENYLRPLLIQAASATGARQNHQQRQTFGEEQNQEDQNRDPLEVEWSSSEGHGYPLLGLDTESPPVRTKGATTSVSLLQVCCGIHLWVIITLLEAHFLQHIR